MAVDLTKVSELDVEPGTLPETMAAWVIREERQGEPKDAFQLEEIEVPEPGAFEVIVRVMAAGVNYNNVWAALGEPVSVMRYGDHPEYGHHIGGSDASGVVWKVGPGVTRWKPGDEVVIHCNQASYEDPEVHGLDPLAAPSQKIWGYETTWGSFAQFTKVQAQQLLPQPQNLTWEEAASYGLVYFTAYRMLITQCDLQAGQRVLIWGAAGGLGVFATQLCAMAGAHAVGVVSSAEKGELVKQLGAVDYIDRNEFAGMMRKGGESPEEEKERFKVSRAFSKRVKEILGDQPDIVFEHVGQATFPTSVFTVKPFGKVVICAGTTGFNLDFDVRYLWMRQKQIIGSHFANAYECNKANELIESGADPAGAVAHARLRGRARGAPADAREQAPGQDLDPGRRRGRGRGQDRGGPGRDPRGGGRVIQRPDPLARQPVPGRQVRRGLAARRRGGARLRRGRRGRFYRAHRRPARLHPGGDLPEQGALRALLVLRADRREAGRAAGLLPGAAAADVPEIVGEGRAAQPCSRGAIVSPRVAELLPVVLGQLLGAGPDDRPAACCGSGWPSPCPGRS